MPPTTEAERAGRLFLSERPLEIYITYDYLSAHQQGTIAVSVAELHRAVLAAAREFEPGDLFVDSVHTDESIRVKFRQGRIMPGWEFPDDDLVILLPRWTAGLFLTAGLLVGGATVLDAVDTFGRHLERNDRQQQEQVVRQHFDLGTLADPGSRIGQDARRHLLTFEGEITAPNISSVRIDGVLIRSRDEDETAPPPAKPSETAPPPPKSRTA